MKIKHTIHASEEEVDALFNHVLVPALASYPAVDEQTAAIHAAKTAFTDVLNKYIKEAFSIGKKIGKAKSDVKDDEMYKTLPAEL